MTDGSSEVTVAVAKGESMSRMVQACIVLLLITVTAEFLTAQAARSFGSGTHLVGTDIEPGLNRGERDILRTPLRAERRIQ